MKRTMLLLAVIVSAAISPAQSSEQTDSLQREMNEIVVNAQPPATRLVGTTLISSIPGSNLAKLGNAIDVLGQLPMIRVDNNTVSVIGKSELEIFIDGRPMGDSSELQQILSSEIKRVELLMAPGAMYNSNTGAVLKIITKRNYIKGLSINDRFELQRHRKWSAMEYLGLNYRCGEWEWFLNGSFNQNNRVVKGVTTNSLRYDGRETVIGSNQYNSYTSTTGAVKAGFNYAKESQSLGGYYRFNPESGHFSNDGSEWIDQSEPVQREIMKRISGRSHHASVYYENLFDGKYRLHFDGDFRSSRNGNRVSTTYPESETADVNSIDRRLSSLWAAKLYLTFPLWKGDFTIGTQDSYTHTSLDFKMFNEDVEQYIPSTLSDSRQLSVASFLTWARMFDRFSLSAGLRYEYVDYNFKSDGNSDASLSRRHNLLTPDISLGYSFSENAQLSLSYNLATVRPPYSQLTGSLNYVGTHEIEGGNPALRDERMHNVQIFGSYNGFMFQSNIIRSIDTYAYVKRQYPAENLQLIMRPINIDVTALSAYIVWSKPIGWWTPDVTLGVYRQWLTVDTTKHERPIFSYYFDNTLSLPKGWLVTANVSGSSRGDMHTNCFGANWFTFDASVTKLFLNGSMSVKFSATDIFNTTSGNWTMKTYGIFVDKRQSYDSRGVTLSLTYNFQPRKSGYKGSSAAEEEMKRL